MTTLHEALNELGRLSPRRIYRLFKAEGLKGDPGSGARCPLARYLVRHTDQTLVVVTHRTVYGYAPYITRSTLPMSVYRFVTRFDSGLRYRGVRT